MIDVHTHLLPFVDDGSQSLQQSLDLLKESKDQGVTDIFLTPHYNIAYKPTKQQLTDSFLQFKESVKENNIDVNLFLGQEIYIEPNSDGKFDKQNWLTLSGTNYVMLEFSYNEYTDIPEITYEYVLNGYIPIICHAERYKYFNLEMAKAVKMHGGLIQVTSNAICGDLKSKYFKVINKLLKNRLIDFVASDVHTSRPSCMGQAYKFISKKYGKSLADKLFIENSSKIIEQTKKKD